MKKLFIAVSVMALALTAQQTSAQIYRNAVGLAIDFGDGTTLVGPSLKHFFNPNNAGEAEILFGNGSTHVGAYYQYHGALANNLNWYLGVGPQMSFYKGNNDTYFGIRPMLGLEHKLVNAPLAISADWRPTMNLTNNSHFYGGRFQMGFKFTF